MSAVRIRDRLLRRHDSLVPPAPADWIVRGPDEFRRSGEELVALALASAGLGPRSRVLDAGCGWGRVARPLTRVLAGADGGRYVGFDVDGEAIAWCVEHYAAHPRFAFTELDVANARYRAQPGERASELMFPYPDASFDVVFACALLTHLVTAEAARYLREIARVLDPGGHAVLTLLLLDHSSRAAVTRGDAPFPLRLDAAAGPMTLLDPDLPETLVAYDRDWLLRQCSDAGLALTASSDGAWRGSPAPTFDDLLIVERKR